MTKSFPGVIALEGVSLDIREAEVHALCGENGAGKSTLMNILAGNLQPDEGEILLHGKEVKIKSQIDAQALGIAIVYQERSLVESLSVAENIFTNNKPQNRWGLIKHGQLIHETQVLLDHLQLNDIRPGMQLGQLSAAQQQMVEIAKALSQNPDILILDEPTASITETETRILFRIIRNLKDRGVSVIYISHRMAEIFEIADRVTILKDGRSQGTLEVNRTVIDEIIRKMVGRSLEKQEFLADTKDEVVLEVKNLSGHRFRDINFQLKKGEILALSGLAGILLASRLGAALATSGRGRELRVITAVIHGGASLLGGHGKIIGALLGTIFMGMVSNIMILARVSGYWQEIVLGLILILAVAVDILAKKRAGTTTREYLKKASGFSPPRVET